MRIIIKSFYLYFLLVSIEIFKKYLYNIYIYFYKIHFFLAFSLNKYLKFILNIEAFKKPSLLKYGLV